MISGLNQEVEILGRTFHFQTELSDQDGLSIRTDVFIGGKVVATRESRLTDDAAAQIDPGALRARMKEHHNKTLDSFVRRFFGRFRQLMGPASALPDDFDDRLVVMSRAFAWMIRSSPFVEIRIDEQMRCHLLKEQIEEWLASERDPRQAAQIWSGIVTFNKYLSEINHRSDLQAYDQQMLIWALDEVQRHGMTGEVLKGLETLYGLDPRLDQSLDHPKDVTRGAWTALLRHVLTEV